jgi:hypothetical protein
MNEEEQQEQQRIEELTELIGKAGLIEQIVAPLKGCVEMDLFEMAEYRYTYHYGNGCAHLEFRPALTDVSDIEGFAKTGLDTIQGQIHHLDILGLLDEWRKLDFLELQVFSFVRAQEGQTIQEGDHFVMEADVLFNGERCPLGVEIYIDEPFDDAEPHEFNPGSEE